MEETAVAKNREVPLCARSSYSFIPALRNDPKELTYFNNEKKDKHTSVFDSVFRRKEGYNEKLHRDDREHANNRGLDIYSEEISKPVPALSSSVYGRLLHLHEDPSDRCFVRVGHVNSEFYRKNGICHSVKEGYGSVTPA
ncbi:uncharacterized protein C5orf49 homolog [Protopterus annectens]|uniref:uncharacterized protein C5orf49 homolog n=1 Tax=Protopterus annectens TaxID=7888 RepID=UPI001CFAEBE2|nr:uncharacterized protein C5orf49 homolog [Protopterus annectens]